MVAHTIIPFVGGHLAKRFYDEPEQVQVSPLMVLVSFANIFIWVVPFIWLIYTMGSLVPTLAMIEDPSPPAYEILASNDDLETAPADPNSKNLPGLPGANGKPITSSIRATHRLLTNVGGWRGRFRGIIPAFVISIASGMLNGFFTASGSPVFLRLGNLFAALALVQLNTAWVHIIMTPSNPLPFWRRLPALRRTFEATCFPVLVNWLAVTGSIALPLLTASLLGLKIWDQRNPADVPQYESKDYWKTFVVWIVSVAAHWVLVIPSQVALRRVQASLLSPEEPTIIPFDSTFKGRVGPAVVDGKGYLTMRDALATFSRADWFRFFKLYVKIFLISVAAFFIMIVAILVQVLLVSASQRTITPTPPQ